MQKLFYYESFNFFFVHVVVVFVIVSVPPHQILVYDASGRDVSGTVGPLYEGDSLVLSCEVRGGEYQLFFIHLDLVGLNHL